MASVNNVIEAKFNAKDRKSVIGPLWQYDYGQILRITGIELPEIYEVHFSNAPRGIAKVISGNPDGVSIPDEYLTTGANVFAWLFLHTGADDGGTEYQIEIQVRRKARPVNIAPTPIEQNMITNLIADIQNVAQEVDTAKEEVKRIIDEGVQSNWDTTDSEDPSYIKNKPELNFMSKDNPTATGSFSMGRQSGTFIGLCSHTEGNSTTASGSYSHAEGYQTTASGDESHAEGERTTASGSRSHAEGAGTKASGTNQHVQGKYNIEDTESKYAHIVGNGTSSTERSNAHTLDWEGNAWYAGEVQATDLKVKKSDGTYASIINLPEGANQQLITDENGNTAWQEQLAYEFGEVFVQLLRYTTNNRENTQLVNPIDITLGKSYRVTLETGGYPSPLFRAINTYTYDAVAVSGDDGISYIECGEADIYVYNDGKIINSFYNDGNPVMRITILRKDKDIKKIDRKFLPEIIPSDMVRRQQLVTDYKGVPVWEDRIGYVLDKQYVLLASRLEAPYYPTSTGVNGSIAKIKVAESLDLIEGEKYCIRRYDNDQDAVEAIAQVREDGVIYVGCPDLENISSDLKFSAYSDGYIYATTGFGGIGNQYIYHVIDEEIKQFDPRLIPNVLGKYNIDDADGIYAYIIGNGTGENARSNAYTLDRSGNAWYAGSVYIGGDETNYNPETAKKLATEEYVQSLIGAVDELLGSGVLS